MKYSKIFLTLCLAIVLSLSAVAIPATPAQAANDIIISPTSGTVGTTITVTGTSFMSNSTVYIFFNDYPWTSASVNIFGFFATSFTVSDSSLSPGVYYVTVKNSLTTGATTIAIAAFTVTEVTVTLSAADGNVGEEIKISGTSFAASKSVTISFDGVAVATTTTDTAGSFTDVTFPVPESYQGSHTIEAKDASNNSATDSFSIKPALTISPTSGLIGTTITAAGNGFKATADIAVTYDVVAVTTLPASVVTDSKGSFSASFNAPASASGSHQVAASDGANTITKVFTTAAATASLDQVTGPVGTEVTASGIGFLSNMPVPITFDDESVGAAYTNANGEFSYPFTVPTRAAGTYKVKISDTVTTREISFSITTSASITPLTSTAAPGYVGTEITVSGAGFIFGRTVTITYDGTQVATAAVLSDGTFSATFSAPASSVGAHSIIASDTINSAQFAFTMESGAPTTPPPLKPEMNLEAEPLVFFDWEDVTDPSGVTYSLQLATAEDFSANSIVLGKSGLIQSEYTLTEAEELEALDKENSYYWHVKATDGAGNESPWSGTGAFYVGSAWGLSQQLIYMLLGVGALLLGVLGFWIGRKTAYY